MMSHHPEWMSLLWGLPCMQRYMLLALALDLAHPPFSAGHLLYL